jgi:hypothetical protein
MSEILVRFLGCATCGVTAQCAQGSAAKHPTKGAAIVTCFHGPVELAQRCTCGASNLLAGTDAVTIIETIERRDVAWLSLPTSRATDSSRDVANTRPSVGDAVSIHLPGRNATAVVIAVTGRDHAAHAQKELALDRRFNPGESGSPVVTTTDQVVGVVRDVCGRCGFVADI